MDQSNEYTQASLIDKLFTLKGQYLKDGEVMTSKTLVCSNHVMKTIKDMISGLDENAKKFKTYAPKDAKALKEWSVKPVSVGQAKFIKAVFIKFIVKAGLVNELEQALNVTFEKKQERTGSNYEELSPAEYLKLLRS